MQHIAKRKTWARIWIVVAFIFLMVANVFLHRFSTDPLNTYGVSRGLTYGCVLWFTVLLVAMWRRHGWARYLLIALICLAIVGFAVLAMILKSETIASLASAMHSVIIGLVLYAASLIPLGASRSLSDYLGPRTAGDR